MEFKVLVLSKLAPIFLRRNFAIFEDGEYLFKFVSDKIDARISFNPRDQICLFQIGQKNQILFEIGDPTLKFHFHTDIRLYNQNMEMFIENLSILIETSLSDIISGDKKALQDLQDFKFREGYEYTLKMSGRRRL